MIKKLEQALILLENINKNSNKKIITFEELNRIKELRRSLKIKCNFKTGGSFDVEELKTLDNIEKYLWKVFSIFRKWGDIFSDFQKLFRMSAKNYSNFVKGSLESDPLYTNVLDFSTRYKILIPQKVKEAIFNDNDIKFLVSIADGFVINDHNEGILILDNELNIKEKVSIFDSMQIDFDFIFKKYSEDALLFFCSKNNCFIYIDLNSLKKKIIEFKKDLFKEVLSKVYYWENNDIILVTTVGKFYRVAIDDKVVEYVLMSEVEYIYPLFYETWMSSLEHSVIEFWGNKKTFVFQDKSIEKVKIIDFTGNELTSIEYFDPKTYNIQYQNKFFMFIQEKKIEIRETDLIKTEILPHSYYEFLKALFVKKEDSIYVVILAKNIAYPISSSLLMYKIVEKKRDFFPRDWNEFDYACL